MKGKWFTFGCLTSIGLLIIMSIIGFSTIGFAVGNIASKKDRLQSDSWLHLKLSGVVEEYKQTKSSPFDERQCAFEIVHKIEKAATDDKIRGILLEPRGFAAGGVTLVNIGKALHDFSQTGKPVYAVFNMGTDRDYLIASYADKIYLTPSFSGGIILTGTGTSKHYYKKLLAKLGIKMHVFHAGKFKGAFENYTRDSMSPELRQNIEPVLDGLYRYKLTVIAENRDMSIEQITDIYEQRDHMFIAPDEALEMGLVDELKQVWELKKELGIDRKKLVGLDDYNMPENICSEPDRIAVIYCMGVIMPKGRWDEDYISSSRLIKTLEEVEKNDKIKAVVLRVNSPGGSALESDIILSRIDALQKVKPVVISMGDIAASGGYFLSCHGDYVYAEPATITGSIGVVSMLPEFEGLKKKLGFKDEYISRGKFIFAINPWQKLSPEMKTSMEYFGASVYKEFKSRISTGREMTMDEVEEVAQGRIWLAETALEHQLIDAVGNLDDAVAKAAELAKTHTWSEQYLPKRKSFFDVLLEEKLDFLQSSIVSKYLAANGFEDLETLINSIGQEPVQMLCPITEIK
ncbi:MAG: signal peptide peptidase SppA [Candidatus Cloacimonetes bacterium]|nr:signal peptide peptidase SppA [Candidatus Cloacimonadota bacterium]